MQDYPWPIVQLTTTESNHLATFDMKPETVYGQTWYSPQVRWARRGDVQTGGRRLPALDGLRGIGIAAVIAYHLNPSWLPGGYLGVDIFFVVSGFLITGLLLDLFGGPTGSALRGFWARRARRLLPGLVVLLFVVAIAAALFAHDAVPELRADIPAALAFVANWRLLLHHDNYFQAIGRPPLLQHLWSLGVEEQFYLAWPFAVLLIVRKVHRRPLQVLCWASFSGAVGSALLMAALYAPSNPSGVYYDTFTHCSGLLIGAGLAGATRGRRVDTGHMARKRRAQLGSAALAGLALMLVFLGSNDGFTYRGGIFLASALTGLVLLVSLQPGSVQRLLRLRPLQYLGRRSYSLYLWHWPVICLTRPDIDVRLSGWPLLVLRLGLIGAGAEMSYNLVEQPFRTGRAQAVLRALRRPGRTAALGSAGACGATAAILLAVVNPPALSAAMVAGSTPAARTELVPTTTTAPGTAAGGTTSSPATTAPSAGASGPVQATTVTSGASPPATPATAPATGEGTAPTTAVAGATATTPASAAPTATTRSAAAGHKPTAGRDRPLPAGRVLSHQVLAIGDSVLLAASTALETRVHGDITVDAVVGRQVWEGISRLEEYREAGDLRGLKALVLDLGTNGPLSPEDVATLRQLAAGVPLVVFVNVRVPQPWQSETNRSLAAVAHQRGVVVVNWYRASRAPGILWADGVHPDPKGQAVYANLVASALASAGVAGA